jgi:hypothetical protein
MLKFYKGQYEMYQSQKIKSIDLTHSFKSVEGIETGSRAGHI